MQSEIALIPGTTYEMLYPEFWLRRIADTDRVLMDEAKIQAFNYRNLKKVGDSARLYDLSDLGDYIEKEDLLSLISEHHLPEAGLYLNGMKFSDQDRKRILENLNFKMIRVQNPVRFGICTHRSDIRIMPTELNLNEEPEDMVTDALQSSAILLNEPLAVLHESADGLWYFIRCSYYDGWVRKAHIGLFHDRNEMRSHTQFLHFLVVTANKLVLPYSVPNPAVSELQLTMGIRLQINEEQKEDYNNYPVWIPVRGEDGYADYQTASIPVSASVCVGYVKYTTRNLLHLVFQTVGDLYGWGGSYQTRDCSSLVFEAFRCFGFQLPRDSANLAKIQSCVSFTSLADHTAEERKQILRQTRPGAILGWPGHTVIYIGHVNDCYYVINYAGHFSIAQPNGTRKRYPVHICLVNDLSVLRDNGISWLETLTYIKSMET